MGFVVQREVIMKNIFFFLGCDTVLEERAAAILKVTLFFNPEDGDIRFLQNVNKHERLHGI
jgi:hypothetical protein